MEIMVHKHYQIEKSNDLTRMELSNLMFHIMGGGGGGGD